MKAERRRKKKEPPATERLPLGMCHGRVKQTYLHFFSSDILIIVIHHVRKESHVVFQPKAPWHFDGLTGEQAVGSAASNPHQRNPKPQHCRPVGKVWFLHELDVFLALKWESFS